MFNLDQKKQFIQKLITLTNTCKITWKYLDKDTPSAEVYEKILNSLIGDFEFIDEDNSFYYTSKNNDTYALVRSSDSNYYLCLIPYTLKGTESITGNECSKLLVELLNNIKYNFPSPQKMMEDILNM